MPLNTKTNILGDDPLWYKDAVIYELHVRAFHDSSGDGMGDFAGLTQKLDYLKDLGVTAIWLLPFYPSPLRDDGYDIADYQKIHSSYGTMADFKRFLREAHKRGLRVITELVINHTSDQHKWFQRARRAKPGSAYRDWYVWSDTAREYGDTRIIFQDFELSNWTWDPVARAYYWHRFFSHQPDLNFDNPQVHKAVIQALEFWLKLGVDGFRLDAIPYLYEREGTNCENLPETHDYLRDLRRHVDAHFPNRLLLAEANQWPEDSVAYFGEGDECHMNFHFPLMPRLYMALQQEDRFPVVDILAQTPEIPDSCQWALFLRNHDELTLEMVSDEERDAMIQAYARHSKARINLGIRRRLAPLLQNDRRRIELMNILLFSLPGSPVLYYGDEIGMGDNFFLGDRNGVRTPMQWSGDRNAGFSRANQQELYLPVILDPEYHYESVNVEAQARNPASLLWWMRRLIALRKRHPAFGRGTIELLHPDNRRVLVFLRTYENEQILVVANLSRHTQFCELDLSRFKGLVPVELFGHTPFPRVGDAPYFITLGPHSAFWFSLEEREDGTQGWALSHEREVPLVVLPLASRWDDIWAPESRSRIEGALSGFLMTQRWFRSKGNVINGARISEVIPVRFDGRTAHVALVDVDYADRDPEVYVVPLLVETGLEAAHGQHATVAHLRLGKKGAPEGLLVDAMGDRGFARRLLQLLTIPAPLRGTRGELRGRTTRAFRQLATAEDLEPRFMAADQSNTSVAYGTRLILKLLRSVESGESLEAEVGAFLTKRGFGGAPALAGVLDYVQPDGSTATLATVHAFVPNGGDSWSYTLDELSVYFERALTMDPAELTRRLEGEAPDAELVQRLVGDYLGTARMLGRRTAELHLALASEAEDEAFAPEPFSQLYQRSLYQSMRNQAVQVMDLLKKRLSSLPEAARVDAELLIACGDALHARLRSVTGAKIDTVRIRCHGDLHLGQVLYTGRDFVITDFEGEPARPLTARRIKRSPLRDVAGMLRSFHYAAWAALFQARANGLLSPDDARPATWLDLWYEAVSDAFLAEYRRVAAGAAFLVSDDEGFRRLLGAYVAEKAVYELGYEINNRPDWVGIPLKGLLRLLE